jgi:hypothetical protein
VLFSLIWIRGFAQGPDINYGETVTGTLKAGETNTWHFVGNAGDVIGLIVERVSGDLEPVIAVLDSGERPVVGTQASSGQGTATLVQLRLPGTGSHLIKISGSGQTAGEYRLALTLSAAAPPTATPQTQTSLEVTAGTLNYGTTARGEISNSVYRQLWRFRGAFGEIIDIRMVAKSGDLDTFLALTSPLGDTVAANDSASGGPDAGILGFQLPYTGEYTIIARRAGDENGRRGTTSGTYELSLVIRGPGTASQNTALQFGTTMIGRLRDEVPSAIYRIESGGALAVELDLGSQHRLASIRFLTTTGSVLASYQGLNPLLVATKLPDKGPFLIEISSTGYENQPQVDFGLTVSRLSANTASATPLRYGAPRRSTATVAEKWFFVGRAGDFIALAVTPDVTSLRTIVRVSGPQDILLYQGDLGPGLQQTLTLTENGVYEIEVRPAEGAAVAYDVRIDRSGANGIGFGRFELVPDRGALPLAEPVSSTLAPGSAEAFWLDATAGQIINLVASPTSRDAAPGLALQGPDGVPVDIQVAERAQGAVIHNALLRQTGRYRVVVFDSKGNIGGQYTLRYQEMAGGELRAGEAVKGIALPANGLTTWSIDVTAGSLINARLTTLTPKAWSPSIFIAEPGGLILASKSQPDADGTLNLLGVQAPVTGKYRIVAAGQVVGTFASFDLVSNVQVPFATNLGAAVQVNSTQPPIGRYALNPPTGPVRLEVADLINPPINLDRVTGNRPITLNANSTVRGEIESGEFEEAWRYNSPPNTTLSFQATSLASTVGPDLALLDKDNKIVAEQLHADDPTTVLTYRVTQAGQYTLVVRMGLKGGRYMLSFNTINAINGPLKIETGAPLVYGQIVPGEHLNGEGVDRYYFIGSANDVISLELTRTTGDLAPAMQLIAPSGNSLANDNNPSNTPTAAFSRFRLPNDGMYTVLVGHGENASSTAGRYVLHLGLDSGFRLQNRGGGIITTGASRTGLVTPTDNQDTWLFVGQAGERVTFIASGLGSPLPSPLGLRLQDTSGQTFALQDVVLTQTSARLVDVMLPADGLYRLLVAGGTTTGGAYTLTWQPERERLVAGPLRYNQTVSGLFTEQRNIDTWVFSGTAGDVISIALNYQRGDKFNAAFRLRSENQLPLVTVPDLGNGARADGLVLPFSGSYTIIVANPDTNYKGAGVYSLSVVLQNSTARSLGGILNYGQQGQGTITAEDTGDTWVFGARAGDTVRLAVRAQDQFLKPSFELRTPDGAVLTSVSAADGDRYGEATVEQYAIQGDGVYVVTITGGPNKTAGGYLLSLDYTPPPVPETETMRYGDTREGLIANDRLRQARVFTGRQGDLVTVRMTRESGSNLAGVLELRSETGQLLARADSLGQEAATITDFRLPQAGQYLLVASRYLDSQGRTSGRYRLALSGTPAEFRIKGTVTYGKLAFGSLGDSNPSERLNFTGKVGDVIGITTTAKSGDLDIRLTLENSAGVVLASNDDATGTNAAVSGVLLPADDTYTIVVSRVGTQTVGSGGNYELAVNLLYQVNATAAPNALLAYGQRVSGSVDPQNTEARYAFNGNQGDVISVQLVHQTDDAPPLFSIQDPAGTTLVSGTLGIGQTTIDRYQLPVSGLYVIVVKRPGNAQQNFSPFAVTLSLRASSAPQQVTTTGGVLIRLNDAITSVFTPGQSAQYWLFQGKAGQTVSMNLLQMSGDLEPSMILISPSGQGLISAAVPERGQSITIERYTLPADGTYSILVMPGGPNRAGQYRLTLQPNVPPLAPTATALAVGQTVSGTIDAIQPAQHWRFEGQQGQMISARILVTSGNLAPRLSLVSADGRVLAEGRVERNSQGVSSVIPEFVLPAGGSYTLVAEQQTEMGPTAGTYRLALEAGSLSTQAVAAEPISYGQLVRKVVQQGATDLWVFSGAAGDTVNIAVAVEPGSASTTAETKALALDLQDAGGRSLAKAVPNGGANGETNGEAMIQGFTLPANGRYVVALASQTTASYTLAVQRRQNLLTDGATTRPLVADRPLDSAITSNTPVEFWVFNAKAGNVVQITGKRLSSDLRLDVALYGPAGYIASATAGPDGSGENVTLGPVRLSEEGAYTLVVTRWLGTLGKTGGRYSLTLSYPSGVSGSAGGFIPIYNRPVTGGIGADDTEDAWTFDGQAGDIVNVRTTRLDGDLSPAIKLIAPDGKTEVATAQASPEKTDEALISGSILPVTGRYTISIGRNGNSTGGYRLVVERTQTAIQASISRAEGIAYDEKKTGELAANAPIRAWVFFGKAGERVTIEAAQANGSKLDPYLYVLTPDGKTLATDDNAGGNTAARIASLLLPVDGFYGVVVTGSPIRQGDERFGAFSVSVQRSQAGAAFQGKIGIGSTVDGTLTTDQPIQEWTFEAKTGQPIAIRVTSPSAVFNSAITLVTSDGRTVAVSGPAQNGAASIDVTLPGPGQYAILISANARGAQGRYRLSLSDALTAK